MPVGPNTAVPDTVQQVMVLMVRLLPLMILPQLLFSPDREEQGEELIWQSGEAQSVSPFPETLS